MADTPVWAERLLSEAWQRHSLGQAPTLAWRKSKIATLSTGRYSPGKNHIVVTAGSDRIDQKVVLLHELAHALTPKHIHDKTFWTCFWMLVKWHGKLNLLAVMHRELRYKTTSIIVAEQMGIRGAKTVHNAYRQQMAANRRARRIWELRLTTVA